MDFLYSDMSLHVASSLYISTVKISLKLSLVNMQLYLLNILHVKNPNRYQTIEFIKPFNTYLKVYIVPYSD